MTRQEFMTRLREGLKGLPVQAVEEAVADYEAHFAEGEAAGRSEAEIAAALGDPDRLARELRAEVGLKRWEQERNPSAAAGAVFAVLGLGALDLLIVLPVLMAIGGVLIGLFVAVVACLIIGAAMLVGSPFFDGPLSVGATMLAGLGLIFGSVSGGAVLTLVSIGLVNALVWYGRLHYQLLKPAIA